MSELFKIVTEIIKKTPRVIRLAWFELISVNTTSYLGILWEIINPFIQIIIYWIVFGTLLKRDNIMVDGVEVTFIQWLMVGYFVWMFFYQATIEASKSIYTRLGMLSQMNFSASLIPLIPIYKKLFIHLTLIYIAFEAVLITNSRVNIHFYQIIYYLLCLILLIGALAYINSAISTIFRDYHLLLNSTLRMMLYISGVLWPISLLSDFPLLQRVLEYNPLLYIIDGYRVAFFGEEIHFANYINQSLIFWSIVVLFYLLGLYIHKSFKNKFYDYL